MEDLLKQTLSVDDQTRKRATHALQQYEIQNYCLFIRDSCKVLSNEEIEAAIRMAAGLALKNSLSSEKSHQGQETSMCWLYLTDEQTRQYIKSDILLSLGSKKRNVANVASQVVAAIAAIELPLNSWPELISTLLNNITLKHYVSSVKQATLQAIGYTLELLDPHVLSIDQSNSILTAIIDGARREQLDVNLKLAAIRALYNSLEFIKNNFEITAERDFIMKVICDGATQHIHSTIDIQISSYECLTRIMQLYYDKMEDYMFSLLFNLTAYGMSRPEQRVTLQAIEFWSTVCDMEIKMKLESSPSLCYFADKSVTYILPNLFSLLVKKDNSTSSSVTDINALIEHDEEDGDWNNIPKSASNCLSLFAACSKDLLVPQTIDFVKQNLFGQQQWNRREAAIIAFGSILEGPSKYKTINLVKEILPAILSSLSDPITHVKIAASWTLSQIIKVSIKLLNPDTILQDMVPLLAKSVCDSDQKMIYNSSLSLTYLSQQIGLLQRRETTGPLSKYTKTLISILLAVSQRSMNNTKDQDSKCKSSVYESISSIIKYSAQDCIHTVHFVATTMLDKLEELIEISKTAEITCQDSSNLQSCLLGVLLSCIYRLEDQVSQLTSRIMTLVFQSIALYFNSKTVTSDSILEDAFLLISALINTTPSTFTPFLPQFLPKFIKALQHQLKEFQQTPLSSSFIPASTTITPTTTSTLRSEEGRLCIITIGVISDISATFPKYTIEYAPKFMQLLFQYLESSVLHPDVKPATLSCIGDVAQSIGPFFMPYLNTTVMAIQQAGNMQADKTDEEWVAYVDMIRISSLDAFVGLIQGLSSSSTSTTATTDENSLSISSNITNEKTKEALLYHVTNFLLFINSIVMDKTRSDRLNRTMLGFLGDIARVYGKIIQRNLVEGLLNSLVMEDAKEICPFSKATRETANWAQQLIKDAYDDEKQ